MARRGWLVGDNSGDLRAWSVGGAVQMEHSPEKPVEEPPLTEDRRPFGRGAGQLCRDAAPSPSAGV